MALNIELHQIDTQLDAQQELRVREHLHHLDARLIHFSEPSAVVSIRRSAEPHVITVDLRVILGSRSRALISHQSAEVPEHAMRLAVEDIERQLERRLAKQRGEDRFGVPSRRLPAESRPHPRSADH